MKCKEKDCNALSLKGDVRCYFHSDKITDKEKKQARTKGGKTKQIKINSAFKYYKLNNISDIMRLNEVLINGTLQNEIDLRIITGIAYNLNLQTKLIELQSIEKRLTELENSYFKL